MVRSPDVDGDDERGGVSGLDALLLLLSDEAYGTRIYIGALRMIDKYNL